MKDSIQNNEVDSESLGSDDISRLKTLVSAAYPAPKRDIRAAVMNEVRAERALARRRAVRDKLVKFGSLAACLILVAILGWNVLPAVVSDTVTTNNGSHNLSFFNSKEVSAECAPKYDMEYDAALAPSEHYDNAMADITDEIEAELPDGTPEAGNSLSICRHMIVRDGVVVDNSYHTISDELILYVGKENAAAYFAKKNAENATTTKCTTVSIVDFVEYFNIPKDVFRNLTSSSNLDYNTDAIYQGTAAAESYYTSDREPHIEKK